MWRKLKSKLLVSTGWKIVKITSVLVFCASGTLLAVVVIFVSGAPSMTACTVEPEVCKIHLIFHAEIGVNSPRDTANFTVKKPISRPNSPKIFTYNMTLFAHHFMYFGSEIHGF
jgi:hypothetical protein